MCLFLAISYLRLDERIEIMDSVFDFLDKIIIYTSPDIQNKIIEIAVKWYVKTS
jgi:hypothetical protein